MRRLRGLFINPIPHPRAVIRRYPGNLRAKRFPPNTVPKRYYEILGLDTEKQYSYQEILKVLRKATMKHHPDTPEGCTEKMQRVNAAREAFANYSEKFLTTECESDEKDKAWLLRVLSELRLEFSHTLFDDADNLLYLIKQHPNDAEKIIQILLRDDAEFERFLTNCYTLFALVMRFPHHAEEFLQRILRFPDLVFRELVSEPSLSFMLLRLAKSFQDQKHAIEFLQRILCFSDTEFNRLAHNERPLLDLIELFPNYTQAFIQRFLCVDAKRYPVTDLDALFRLSELFPKHVEKFIDRILRSSVAVFRQLGSEFSFELPRLATFLQDQGYATEFIQRFVDSSDTEFKWLLHTECQWLELIALFPDYTEAFIQRLLRSSDTEFKWLRGNKYLLIVDLIKQFPHHAEAFIQKILHSDAIIKSFEGDLAVVLKLAQQFPQHTEELMQRVLRVVRIDGDFKLRAENDYVVLAAIKLFPRHTRELLSALNLNFLIPLIFLCVAAGSALATHLAIQVVQVFLHELLIRVRVFRPRVFTGNPLPAAIASKTPKTNDTPGLAPRV